MRERLFALASVAALTGLAVAVAAAGCGQVLDSIAPTPAKDAGVRASRDSGRPEAMDAAVEAEPCEDCGWCMPVKPFAHDTIPYAKAKRMVGACTLDEAADLEQFIDDKIAAKDLTFKQSEWVAAVSPGCASCVFSKADDPEWGVIIAKADDPETFFTYNRGGCIEIESAKDVWKGLSAAS